MISKNLPIKPNNGGTPARDKILKNKEILIKFKIDKFLKSFKVLIFLKSTKKSI